MTLWIAIAALTVIALGIIVLPVLRGGKNAAKRADYDVALFKEQLKELDRERETGLLNEAEAEAARQELERRLLVADAERNQEAALAEDRVSPVGLGAALAVTVAASVALYFYLGQPHLPDFPIAQRDLEKEQNVQADAELKKMLGALEKRLQENPADLKGWRMLGRSYAAMDRYDEAAEAFKKAAALTGDDKQAYSSVLTNFVENRFFAGNGQVDEQISDAIAKARSADPLNMKAWFYDAFLKSKTGDVKGALQDWVDMKAVAPEDAAWLPQVESQIAAAAKALGVDAASVKPTPGLHEELNKLAGQEAAAQAEAELKGPTAEQMRDAAAMSEEERAAMIRSMVEGLAARLEENPDDKEGWLKLARAYRVLGETAKAEEAERRAAGGGGGSQTSVDIPKGTSEGLKKQIADLRQKIEDDPKDLESLQILGRTLLSMGEADQAIPVFAKAVDLKPQDKAVLTEHASAILSATPEGDKFSPEFIEAIKKIEALDPNDSNALWYLGMAAQQTGDKQGALAYWNKLLALLKPDTIPYAKLKTQIDALK